MQDLMINKKRDLPGPGQYSPKNTMSKDGVYKLSGFKNTSALTFRPSDRFKQGCELSTFPIKILI